MTEQFVIGQNVMYTPTKEIGVVTSKNESFVFVRYGTQLHSQATRPSDLKQTTKK